MKKASLHKYPILLAVVSLFLLLHQCVEPFMPALSDDEAVNLLVVEGLITDETGAFSVSLASTSPVYNDNINISDEFRPVTGAVVQIADDKGSTYLLIENRSGWYETEDKNLKGIPGFTYTLLITTAKGIQYESLPVLMQEGPDIDQVHYEEVTHTYFDQELPYEENWLNILVETRAPGDEITYFKWDFEETWEFEMPEYVWVNHGTGESSTPPTMERIDIEYEKKHCWVSEPSGSILIKSTIDSPTNEIKNFVLQSIAPPNDRLNIKYSILVKQYVISRDLYNFFKLLRESNMETGGIYEKTPVQIIGNIQCCNGSEQALGYFMASAVKTKRIYIDPSEHHIAKGTAYDGCGWTTEKPRYQKVYFYGTYNSGITDTWSTNIYCTDCRVRGTNVKPDFWE